MTMLPNDIFAMLMWSPFGKRISTLPDVSFSTFIQCHFSNHMAILPNDVNLTSILCHFGVPQTEEYSVTGLYIAHGNILLSVIWILSFHASLHWAQWLLIAWQRSSHMQFGKPGLTKSAVLWQKIFHLSRNIFNCSCKPESDNSIFFCLITIWQRCPMMCLQCKCKVILASIY